MISASAHLCTLLVAIAAQNFLPRSLSSLWVIKNNGKEQHQRQHEADVSCCTSQPDGCTTYNVCIEVGGGKYDRLLCSKLANRTRMRDSAVVLWNAQHAFSLSVLHYKLGSFFFWGIVQIYQWIVETNQVLPSWYSNVFGHSWSFSFLLRRSFVRFRRCIVYAAVSRQFVLLAWWWHQAWLWYEVLEFTENAYSFVPQSTFFSRAGTN